MKTLQAIVDRIEGKIAVLEVEGKTWIELPKQFLPRGTKEGSVLKISIEIDEKAYEERIEKVKKLQEKLKKQKNK